MPTLVQASQVNSAFPLILSGNAMILPAEVIVGNGSRGAGYDIKQYTIMCQVASSMKWAPWLNANLGDNTGLQYPMGILVSDTIPAASVIAGDVAGNAILIGGAGCQIDVNLLVFDKGNSGGGTAPALTNIMTVPTGIAMIAERWLNMLGIFPTGSLQGDLTEN